MFIIALQIFTLKFIRVPVHIVLPIFTFKFIRMILHKTNITNITYFIILTPISSQISMLTPTTWLILMIRIAIKYTVIFYVFQIVYNAKLTYINKLKTQTYLFKNKMMNIRSYFLHFFTIACNCLQIRTPYWIN